MKNNTLNGRKILVICIASLLVLACVIACFWAVKYKSTAKHNTASVETAEPIATFETAEPKPAAPPDDAPDETSAAGIYTPFAEEEIKKVSGDIQWGIHFYSDNSKYISSSAPVPSASIIKIFIMEYAIAKTESGEISSDSIVEQSTLGELIERMITVSDNDATNTLIEYFGMDKLNVYFKEKGYADTKLQRKMLDTEAMANGKDNYTSVNDVMLFLDRLYSGMGTNGCDTMLDIMKKQQINTKIRKKFPPDAVIANKTGELSDVENDIGIIFSPKADYAVVFLFSSLSNNETARDVIADVSFGIYQKINS